MSPNRLWRIELAYSLCLLLSVSKYIMLTYFADTSHMGSICSYSNPSIHFPITIFRNSCGSISGYISLISLHIDCLWCAFFGHCISIWIAFSNAPKSQLIHIRDPIGCLFSLHSSSFSMVALRPIITLSRSSRLDSFPLVMNHSVISRDQVLSQTICFQRALIIWAPNTISLTSGITLSV